MRPQSLKAHLALAFGGITLILTLVLGLIIGQTTTRQVQRDIGHSLAELAFQMSDKLDRGMFERYRDIQIVSALNVMRDPTADPAERRALLEQLQDTYPDYAWIGFADPRGNVQASTKALLEGVDVSQRPWYQGALSQPFVGDVHEAMLLAKLLPNKTGEPLRFVDVSVPVMSRQGAPLGVLGAHLSWTWAQEVERSVLQTVGDRGTIEMLVLSKEGNVLLGPAELRGQSLKLRSLQQAQQGVNGYLIEQWPDGKTYLTGFSASSGYRSYPGLGWITVTRQAVDAAFTPVRSLQLQIFVVGFLISLLFIVVGWLMAGRIAQPLLALSSAARRIRQGDMSAQLPVVPSYAEVNILSTSLSGLVSSLLQHKAELQSLNESLEQRVHDRTEALTRSNAELTKEIAERQRIEHEREVLIKQLKQLAETDALTGLLNRRAFFSLADREMKRTQRHELPLAVVIFDVDRFKLINDTYGHAIGDQVLQSVAHVCLSLARDIDILARYGGEEFVLLVQDADAETAQHVAERLRVGIMQTEIPSDSGPITATASFGVAATSTPISDLAPLLQQADAALYEAKRTGRNRVIVHQPEVALALDATPFDGVGSA
ncbi:MAG TPA: diguanylate cyclase [Herpetosiphonaceae bacterium]